MARIPSGITKLHRKMGRGEGKDYIPYITTSEFNSLGTTSVIKDWINGREVHCLSQGEACWYYILRYSDEYIDIREQYPLERKKTEDIARSFGFKHPGTTKNYIMTTDFLATKKDNSKVAFSVKTNDKELSDRALQILCIEKQYWINEGCGFKILFKEDVNTTLVENIRSVTLFYQAENVFDENSRIKHLIAQKKLAWDMENQRITNDLLNKWREK